MATGDDPSVLVAAPAGLLPWVVQNLEMAVSQPNQEQDDLATVMVGALLVTAMPGDIAPRQSALAASLTRCLSR